MPVRILILFLISPVVVVFFPESAPGSAAGGPRASLAVAAAVGQDDGCACGECPFPEPETGRGRQAALFPARSKSEPGAAREGGDDSPGRGPGPILASLSDSLTISRPPPPQRRSGTAGCCDANPRDSE